MNRRKFIKTAVASGFIGVLYGCGGYSSFAIKEEDKPTLGLIKKIQWETDNPAHVDTLIGHLKKAANDKNRVITLATAQALALREGKNIVKELTDAFEKFRNDGSDTQFFIVDLITLNYVNNPDARQDIINFLLSVYDFQFRSKYSKALRKKAYSGLIFIGNETLRPIRINIRKTRLIDDEGYELLQEFYLTVLTFMIDGSISPKIARYPDIWKLRTIYLRRRASGKTPEEKADDKTNADITPEKIIT